MPPIFCRPVARSLFSAILIAAAAGAQSPPQATIRIDTERAIGEVDPMLFGNFVEQLGRCVYGGVYDPGNPLSDADGYRKDVLKAVRDLGPTLLRWPGGNFVSGYNWEDGVGPRDKRPVRRDDAWGALETNQFGTDEFLKYCDRAGAQPYICINAGLGSVDQARHWVEYCNETAHTHYADMRRANGHDQPWNVKYWGLGNEIDGPWQLGHKNAEDYAKFALQAATAMRRADASIKLIASGSSNFRPGYDWVGWNRTVLDTLKNDIDYISLHTYIGNPANDLEKFLANGADIDRRIAIVQGQIKAAQEFQTTPRPIYIAFDEWNVWYRTFAPTEFEIGRKGLEEHYNFEDALAMGMFLNSFLRHADVVRLANLAQLVNVIAPIFTDKNRLFLQTIYWPVAEYGKEKGSTALDVLTLSPTYAYEGGQIGYLDVSATYSADRHQVRLNVLNRSRDRDIATRVENVKGSLAAGVHVWQMANDDLKAMNTFGDEKIRPAVMSSTQTIAQNGFTFTFPKHSLTILTLDVQ
jgi:alpha-N-arabinofuranosidase